MSTARSRKHADAAAPEVSSEQLGQMLVTAFTTMQGRGGISDVIRACTTTGIDLTTAAPQITTLLVHHLAKTKKDARARMIMAAKELPRGPWQDDLAKPIVSYAKQADPFVAAHAVAWSGRHRSALQTAEVIHAVHHDVIGAPTAFRLFSDGKPTAWLCAERERFSQPERQVIASALRERSERYRTQAGRYEYAADPLDEAAARLGDTSPATVARLATWTEERAEAQSGRETVRQWFAADVTEPTRRAHLHLLVDLATNGNDAQSVRAMTTLASFGA